MGRPTEGFKWQPHRIGAAIYDLSHLHPYVWEYTVPATATKPARPFRIAVSFGLHCFSRDREAGEAVNADHHYSDNRETRVFCLQRYELSKLLPGIMHTLDSRRCLHSGSEEFITIEVVQEEVTIYYTVFFTVTRASKGRGVDLNLFVNSAHERKGGLRKNKPIKFAFIVLNRYENRTINLPP